MRPGKLNGSIRRTEPDEDDKRDGITFDEQGRMNFHPEFHPNHGKPITLDEKIYIAKYVDIDGSRNVGFALGRTETTIANTKSKMNRNGELQYYRSLTDDEWISMLTDVSA